MQKMHLDHLIEKKCDLSFEPNRTALCKHDYSIFMDLVPPWGTPIKNTALTYPIPHSMTKIICLTINLSNKALSHP